MSQPRVPFKNLSGPVPPFPLARGGAALLILDVHRFTADPSAGYGRLAAERGIQHELAEYYEQLQQALSHLERLVQGCRQHGVPVLFTRLVADRRRGDDWVSPQARVTGFWTSGDSPEAAFLPRLTPAPGEDVIDKTAISALGAPESEAALGRRGVRYLILAGVSANGAVEHTARDAGDRGYGVVIVSDACAADTWALHTHVMTTLAGGLIRVRNTQAVLEMLDGART